MQSFYCSWSVGTFQNLTEPGDLRLFYTYDTQTEWKECPKYTLLRENECFFDEEHTQFWEDYKIELRSRDESIIYDEDLFTVETIVYPDPPVGLNWTILSVGMTKMYTDVLISWEPPPSAAVSVEEGWLSLAYETHYREPGSATWNILNADCETKKNIYGLRTNTDYEIRIRCKCKTSNNFSNFSDSIMISVPATGRKRPGSLTKQSPHLDQSQRPHLTGCVSREMESFYCSWNVGTFQNLTEPGDLRLFYTFSIPQKPGEWKECPKYTLLRENECYFDKRHTQVWVAYKIELRSRDQSIIYDEDLFTVETIVYPDPPVGLNWTILSVGMTKMYTDVLISWEPPPSAAVSVEEGWLSLAYETHYREPGSATWNILDADTETKKYIYGLRTNTDYEIRLRCKMKSSNNFSNFSESIMISVPATESRVPIAVGFIFTAVGFAVIGMLVLVSRQKKLMVIFLPPVPGPKIRGIDPELLQKGKLSELTSILTSHAVLRSDLYNNDPWVEFIEVDLEKPSAIEQDLETAFLIDNSPSDSTHLISDFHDDDSGRASCCEQDLPEPESVEFRTPMLSSSSNLDPTATPRTETQSQVVVATSQDSWPGTPDLYAQVKQVTPLGEVVLTPEKQNQKGEAINKQDKMKRDQTRKEPDFHLLVLEDEKGNTTEPGVNMSMNQSTEDHSPSLSPTEDVNFAPRQPLMDYQESQVASATAPESSVPQSSAQPSPEYTVVDGTDPQNSLLLRSNAPLAPSSSNIKQMPSPEGYLSPDLLDSIPF
ncbi:growth hormone receptor b isoform X2 [Sardina pilchardus]